MKRAIIVVALLSLAIGTGAESLVNLPKELGSTPSAVTPSLAGPADNALPCNTKQECFEYCRKDPEKCRQLFGEGAPGLDAKYPTPSNGASGGSGGGFNSGPMQYGGPGSYGPSIDFGAELPAEAFIGQALDKIYSSPEEFASRHGLDLAQACQPQKQPELVALLEADLSASGGLAQDVCADMLPPDMADMCGDVKAFCTEQSKAYSDWDGPRISVPGSRAEFQVSCADAANEEAIISKCLNALGEGNNEMKQEIEEDCAISYIMAEPELNRFCQQGQEQDSQCNAARLDELYRNCISASAPQNQPYVVQQSQDQNQPNQPMQPQQPQVVQQTQVVQQCPPAPQCPQGQALAYDARDANNCMVNARCEGGPTTATPAPTTPTIEPTVTPAPEPTATPAPEPTTTPETASTQASAISGFFVAAQLFPEEQRADCDRRLKEMREQCSRQQGDDQRTPWGVNRADCSSGTIPKEAFIKSCASDRNRGGYSSALSDPEKQRQVCILTASKAKRMLRDCTRPAEECTRQATRACEAAKQRQTKCAEYSTAEKLRPALKRMVSDACRQYSYRPVLESRAASDGVQSLIAAVPDAQGPACEAELKTAGARIEGFQKIGGNTRVYFIDIEPDGVAAIKAVGCAEIRPNTAAMVLRQGTAGGSYGGLDDVAYALQASAEEAEDSQVAAALGYQGSQVGEIADNFKELEEADKGKDAAYKLQQFFGLKAEQESAESAALDAEITKLEKTNSELERIAAALYESNPAQAALVQNVLAENRKRAETLRNLAKSKRQWSAGIIGAIGG